MSKSVRENAIETALCQAVEARGGIAEKVVALGRRGFFDRLITLPTPNGPRIIFCEVKRPKGGRLRPHQKTRRERYANLGCEVALVKNLADIERLLDGGEGRGG